MRRPFALLAVLGLTLWAWSSTPVLVPPAKITPSKTPTSPHGIRALCDFPVALHMKNTGGSDGPFGPGSGSGLCVWTAIEMQARWQNVRTLDGLQKWMTYRPGGGWPSKVVRMLKQFCDEKKVAVPRYVQHTGGDLAFLDLALKTRRFAGVTYSGRDDFYRGRISHMVNAAHLDTNVACIVDNNRPGTFLWMTRAEFASRWREIGGWAVVLLDAPPPPGPEIVGQCPDGRCPIPPPLNPNAGPWLRDGNYGIDLEGIDKNGQRYWVNGVEVTREAALAAVGDGLVDDSDRYHLSIVAGPTVADQVRAVLADPRVAGMVAKCHVQIYAPDSWAVASGRIAAPVQFQEPAGRGGKILATSRTLSVEDLAAMLSPALDPKPAPAPAPRPAPEPAPEPRPAPCPCPNPCPCPRPTPAPVPPLAPPADPCGPTPDIWTSLLALIAAYAAKRRT
jgi:hypothetical protein